MRRAEMVSLVVATVVPFIVIVGLLYPQSVGIHGATHADYMNDWGFEDVIDPITNTTVGTVFYVDYNTGWVSCNGKVRFIGDLHIEDTDVRVTVDQDHWSGHWSVESQQTIYLEGTRGEMTEGFPFFLLGLYGPAAGLAMWSTWFFSRRRDDHEGAIFIVSTLLGVMSFGTAVFFPACLTSMGLVAVLLIVSYFVYKGRSKSLSGSFAYLATGIGLVLLIGSALVLISPNHCEPSLGLCSYSQLAAEMSIAMGTIGLISSSVLVGFGIGKMTYLGPPKEELGDRSAS